MKITKFVHSCLLVETPDRTALFDPGMMSEAVFDVSRLARLDDIFITHEHPDHVSLSFVKQLVARFPSVRITTTAPVIAALSAEGIRATEAPPAGVTFFESPHENVQPWLPTPVEIGVHYLDQFTDPGDSHHFSETKPILALPVTAPWGASIKAMQLAIELKPQYVVPVHDWHWSDDARRQMYDGFEQVLGARGITFFKMETGVPVEVTV